LRQILFKKNRSIIFSIEWVQTDRQTKILKIAKILSIPRKQPRQNLNEIATFFRSRKTTVCIYVCI
jgi:hypothetical protein